MTTPTIEEQVPHLAEGVVLNGCNLLVDLQVWPGTSKIDPVPWLRNFRKHELVYAHNLLSNFLYYSEPLVDALFSASFQNLSRRVRPVGASFPDALIAWQKFCDDVVVTVVEGEEPNPTDSGYLFARKARQVLGIAEERVLKPADALAFALQKKTRAIVFVDDFVGSGNQFLTTWTRLYKVGTSYTSFKQALGNSAGVAVHYCNAITSRAGADRIAQECPSAQISSGHILPLEYSWTHPSSTLWAKPLLANGPEIVRQASIRAGIPIDDGVKDHWRGYEKLSLGLAFAHSVPDATMPIFYWEQNGWHPLIRRR